MHTRAQSSSAPFNAGTRALVGLCAFEVALFLGAIAWQKALDLTAAALGGKLALLILGGVVLGAASIVMLSRVFVRSTAAGRRAFAFALVVNLAGLGLALAGAEVLLRLAAQQTNEGLVVGPVTIPPTWAETRARNAAILAGGPSVRDHWLSYVVGDPDLGWTIGPNRRTPDGMYFSSVEGIRSGAPDVAFASRRPALRVALVGDSHTFSMDGPFEDSWGRQLEARLGPDAQVLNFGVDGYGVDQAYLRYRRDVRQWQPDIVLFGLVQHDLVRTVAVYPFLSFNWDYPFEKPRFEIDGGDLRLINTPLLTASDIVRLDDAAELPFADYDLGYQLADWRWRSGQPPLVARLFATAFPRWRAPGGRVSDQAAIEISGHIVRKFMQLAAEDGVAARIIYFPSDGAGDFGKAVRPESRIARRMLADYAVEHLDLTDCVLQVPSDQRLIPGHSHYSGRSNGQVARCVEADLAERGWLARTDD